MRSQVGGDPGPNYNLARSWAHYGSNAGGPAIGTIVVWRHHVGKIVGRNNGQWIVRSGNDGHAVRTRARSLAGVIAFRNLWGDLNEPDPCTPGFSPGHATGGAKAVDRMIRTNSSGIPTGLCTSSAVPNCDRFCTVQSMAPPPPI
jgi:hypothetical protein